MANESRVAIVTGASSGMGEALSKDLVSKGWKVVLVSHVARISLMIG